jgi:chaperonin GroES
LDRSFAKIIDENRPVSDTVLQNESGVLAMSKLRPLGNRVLIQRTKVKTSKGGILLPETAQEKPKEGTVIAVGPGKVNEDGKVEPMAVRLGDVVLFSSYAGTEVKSDTSDDELLIVSEDEILGIVGV